MMIMPIAFRETGGMHVPIPYVKALQDMKKPSQSNESFRKMTEFFANLHQTFILY